MPVYIYRAATKDGQVVRNRVEEINRFMLLRKLKNNDLLPISVTQINTRINKNLQKRKKNVESNTSVLKSIRSKEIEKNMNSKTKVFAEKAKQKLFSNVRITHKDLVIFTQDFYLLKKANFNNIHALTTIIESTQNPSLKGILEDILLGVEAGENMYTTMEYYSDVFPYIYINMIKVGELSGSLTNSLDQAIKYLDSSAALNKKIKGILIPNIVQFILLIVMLFVGTIVAIPAIQNVYDSFGTSTKLPALTIWFQGVVNWIMAYWYIPTIIILAIIAAIIFYINTPKGKYNFDYFKYKMPIFGQLIFALDFSRLMKAMLLNLNNGMRIQEAIEVSKNVVQNYVMLSIIETSLNNIIIGDSWIEPFEKSGLAKPMITEMLRIGMQTDLPEMMEKLVDYMEIDIDNIMQKIIKVLPETVYMIVGVVLIFFVLVVLVPCIQAYMGGWLFDAAGL